MEKLLIISLLLSYGCSQVKPQSHDDVSIDAALNQAQSSYLLGCVQASTSSKVNPVFPMCRDRAIKHRLEIEEMIKQIPLPASVTLPLN